MQYKIGDKIRLTTLTYGEAITDRKGKIVPMSPHKSVYKGTVKYVGPEIPGSLTACTVVKCTGGNVALDLNSGFSFYPKDNGPEQMVEVLPNPKQNTIESLALHKFTSIDDMCAVLDSLRIKSTEHTDCAVLYNVTFDQLRMVYDAGRKAIK